MAKKNRIAGLILCVIFAIALFMAFSFPNQSSYFPKIVCTLGLLLSLLLIGLAFSAEKKGTSEEVEPLSPKARKRIFLVSALIILYAIGITVLGFAVSTFIYMVINSVILYPEKLSKDNKKTNDHHIGLCPAGFCTYYSGIQTVFVYPAAHRPTYLERRMFRCSRTL